MKFLIATTRLALATILTTTAISMAVFCIRTAIAATPATPHVGDWVSYDQNVNHGGNRLIHQWGKKIDGVNESQTVFVVKSWDSGGQQLKSQANGPELTYTGDLKTFCDSFGSYGVPHSLEILRTAHRRFHTCKTQEATETVWYSNEVPFGKVKTVQQMPGGDSREETLNDYGWGTSI